RTPQKEKHRREARTRSDLHLGDRSYFQGSVKEFRRSISERTGPFSSPITSAGRTAVRTRLPWSALRPQLDVPCCRATPVIARKSRRFSSLFPRQPQILISSLCRFRSRVSNHSRLNAAI